MKKMLLIVCAAALALLILAPAGSQGQVPPKPAKTWSLSNVIHLVTSCPGLPPGPWNLALTDVSKMKPFRGLVMRGEPLTNGPKKMPRKKEK